MHRLELFRLFTYVLFLRQRVRQGVTPVHPLDAPTYQVPR